MPRVRATDGMLSGRDIERVGSASLLRFAMVASRWVLDGGGGSGTGGRGTCALGTTARARKRNGSADRLGFLFSVME
jgi:hypothetical protein